MKKLHLYEKLALKNEEQVFDFLMRTLRQSIFTWEFFVDWKKIAKKVEEFETELNILNTLVGKSRSEIKFIELLRKYPGTKKVLPLLIAIRIERLKKTPIADEKDIDNLRAELKRDYFKIRDSINRQAELELKRFYIESGLKNLLEEKSIKNLVDYYTGIEVGMDTNARKNRVGDIMQDIIENYLSITFSKYKNIDFIPQATKSKVFQEWHYVMEVDKTNRIFDFAIFDQKAKKLFLLETNFYSGGGSKLKATAGEYRQVDTFLNQHREKLIWITDGLGWHTARNPLKETFLKNDFVFNLNFVKKGALKEILSLK